VLTGISRSYDTRLGTPLPLHRLLPHPLTAPILLTRFSARPLRFQFRPAHALKEVVQVVVHCSALCTPLVLSTFSCQNIESKRHLDGVCEYQLSDVSCPFQGGFIYVVLTVVKW